MKREERFHKAKEYAKRVSVLNDRCDAYCESDYEAFCDNMRYVQNSDPNLWKGVLWNRQQCYSNIYSKLLMAYFLSEIKVGTILDKDFLCSIKNHELDEWKEFNYYDIGYKNASVLDKIVRCVIEQEDLFEFAVSYVDFSHLFDENGEVHINETIFSELILEEFPHLKEVLTKDEAKVAFSNICWAIECCSQLELEVEIVESKILYQIMEREKLEVSNLGAEIVDLSRNTFLNLIRQDYLIYDLAWEVVSHKEKKVYYYLFSSSEILGDSSVFNEEVEDRLYRYNYQSIFDIMDLQKKMKQYMKK